MNNILEGKLRASGYLRIAGVDEAGRGPLAGPVVAAAIILPDDFDLPGLNDSKKLSPNQREGLFPRILQGALTIGIATIDAPEIDRLNILQATMQAMKEAILCLEVKPDLVLVDGNRTPGSSCLEQAIVKGDSRCCSIAAASIVAKVTRDRLMVEYDARFPQYGFAKHKGYPTIRHIEALKRYGFCPIHRRSFRPVREIEEVRNSLFAL